MTTDLISNLDLLESRCVTAGIQKFRARQIVHWIFGKRARGFDEMTDLPLDLRSRLSAEYDLFSTSVARRETSSDGTEKLLIRLRDNLHVECVLLRDGSRRSICVSSQVGCAMGCVFCASGLDGVQRNLTSAEIIEQMLHLQLLLPVDERLSHIVMMGMGEPLANVENVLQALKWASNGNGLGISPRRITISTVGLPPAIRRLAAQDCRYQLAISLHAPNDALRNQLVPVNKNVGVAELIKAADDYFDVSGRKLTFEYVLLDQINDQVEHARELGQLLKGKIAMLNVIPYNPVAGLPYRTPGPATIAQFRQILETAGIIVKFRQRKGDQINAACGQLRRSIVQIEPRQRVSVDT